MYWKKLAVMGCCLIGLGVEARSQERPYIRRVDRTTASMDREIRSSSLMGSRMPKFLDERAGTRETFVVRWKAPRQGLDAGVLVLFEYKQGREDGVKNLHIKYPFRVAGERVSEFVVSEKAIERAGPLYAWRVRIVLRGRLLAEERSASWK
ncbi:MAG TPA: hypothetical protein DCZ95_00930 [Verrucomicrobia bacterium]|nr:MAG: hypothetical protein A2X46_12170 [Lentisphaerae bacterium GWF2_57_35]HBA82632.1 hypothetical protein [Verrucomicrobiota bacterium]